MRTPSVGRTGACLNYELSARLVRDMVVDLMPGKLSVFHRSVTKHQDNLLSYFIFLRVRRHMQAHCAVGDDSSNADLYSCSNLMGLCDGGVRVRLGLRVRFGP